MSRDFTEWPREESNLRTQIRSLPLYPLSYGARRQYARLTEWFEIEGPRVGLEHLSLEKGVSWVPSIRSWRSTETT
jgi:hypothetical protein